MANMCVAIAAMLAAVAPLQTSAAETKHVVGGKLGWLVPHNDERLYKTWADDQKAFVVSDVLEFNFPNEERDVVRVTRVAFESCDSTDPIEIAETNLFEFKLKEAREYYFVGTWRQGCFAGQNLAVTAPSLSGFMKKTTPLKPARPSAVATTGKTTKGGTKKKDSARERKKGIR